MTRKSHARHHVYFVDYAGNLTDGTSFQGNNVVTVPGPIQTEADIRRIERLLPCRSVFATSSCCVSKRDES